MPDAEARGPNPEHDRTCLYRHFDCEGKLLYVGVSLHVLSRLSAHARISPWFHRIAHVHIEHFDSRKEALAAERAAIAEEHPECNIVLQRSKSARRDRHAELSAQRLTERVAEFAPIYSLKEAATALKMPLPRVKQLIEAGELGFVELFVRCGNPQTKITGWQIIEFLESRQQRKVTSR